MKQKPDSHLSYNNTHSLLYSNELVKTTSLYKSIRRNDSTSSSSLLSHVPLSSITPHSSSNRILSSSATGKHYTWKNKSLTDLTASSLRHNNTHSAQRNEHIKQQHKCDEMRDRGIMAESQYSGVQLVDRIHSVNKLSERRRQQRNEIYALNDIMAKLEESRFKSFTSQSASVWHASSHVMSCLKTASWLLLSALYYLTVSVCLSVCMSVCLPVSVCLCACLSVNIVIY